MLNLWDPLSNIRPIDVEPVRPTNIRPIDVEPVRPWHDWTGNIVQKVISAILYQVADDQSCVRVGGGGIPFICGI